WQTGGSWTAPWQADGGDKPALRAVAEVDAAAMAVDHALDDGQAQPGTARWRALATREALEHALGISRSDASAMVGDGQHGLPALHGQRDLQRAITAILHCVVHQVL